MGAPWPWAHPHGCAPAAHAAGPHPHLQLSHTGTHLAGCLPAWSRPGFVPVPVPLWEPQASGEQVLPANLSSSPSSTRVLGDTPPRSTPQAQEAVLGVHGALLQRHS